MHKLLLIERKGFLNCILKALFIIHLLFMGSILNFVSKIQLGMSTIYKGFENIKYQIFGAEILNLRQATVGGYLARSLNCNF